MSRKSDCRSILTSLWFRLITLGVIGLVFAEALAEAQIWNIDRSVENPGLAEPLRAVIYARLPELVQKFS
jgi:hypothetical protein